MVQTLGIGLPTLFLAGVTWPAAWLAERGDITVGQLVWVYGYVAMLVRPVAFWVDRDYQISRGLVRARPADGSCGWRRRRTPDRETPRPNRHPWTTRSGVRILLGRLTTLVAEHPADAVVVVDRLGRYTPSDATWGGTRLEDIALGQIRDRALVADHESDLIAGTLADLPDTRKPSA